MTTPTWTTESPDQPRPRPGTDPGAATGWLPDAPPEPARLGDQPAPAPTPPARSARSTRWVRWALGGLLTGTAVLYLWGLSRNGWANAYYAAAAQAGGSSWKAWFFGGLDAASSITVDKPPLSLWLSGLSVRIFGLSSWSILVPQALLGVASVGVLFATVRRWFGPQAGLIAGSVLALTPVATLMFRFNNPDAMLVFLLVCAAWAMGRATQRGALRWIMLAGCFVGLAFLAKMMQAFLVLPGFVLMYAVAAPIALRRRLGHLLAAFATMLVAGGWWVAIVELWPVSSRPYVGGSQTNSVLELMFGYNGFGRLTGNETGSVVGGGAGGPGGATGGMWGETGWGRLFEASYGGQASWLLPAALVMLAVLLWVSRRAARTDLTRAAAIGWGGWLLVTAAVISFSKGIIHEYYTVALAPAIGALLGIGAMALWAHRAQRWARLVAAGTIAGSAWWAWVLLSRSADFVPWLRPLVLGGGIAVAVVLLLGPLVTERWRGRLAVAAAAGGLLVLLAGPTAYSLETAATTATGSLPSAGPSVAGARGGPGGLRGGPQGGPGTLPGSAGGAAGGFPGGVPGGGVPPGGPPPGALPSGSTPGATGPRAGSTGQAFPRPQGTTGGAGGLLEGSQPGAALTAALSEDADSYTWVAAAVGANSAAGYQLATQRPVMAIGGFNGSDASPTL
ncbi:MAG TPA: glycosyltransferase family 39 protein, partial [Candidatus Nanopelagicales bacterium]